MDESLGLVLELAFSISDYKESGFGGFGKRLGSPEMYLVGGNLSLLQATVAMLCHNLA
jgi:hypothetical protein